MWVRTQTYGVVYTRYPKREKKKDKGGRDVAVKGKAMVTNFHIVENRLTLLKEYGIYCIVRVFLFIFMFYFFSFISV